jgi:hypothetical protein
MWSMDHVSAMYIMTATGISGLFRRGTYLKIRMAAYNWGV